MKTIAGLILLLFGIVLSLALYDAPERLSNEGQQAVEASEHEPAEPDEQPLSTAERKKRFIEQTLPAILRVKNELDQIHGYVLQLSKKESLTPGERRFVNSLKERYKVDGIPCLLRRLRTHPASIVLAQAALESGWGTSRFYREANNIFGIWSYNKKEPRLAAGQTRSGKTIYVKKYKTLDDSIRGYFKMMATGYAYDRFREARQKEQNPFLLIRHLDHYSELREEYVKRLYHVIRSGRFYRYDSPSFQPIPLAQIIPEYLKKQEEARSRQIADKAPLPKPGSASENLPEQHSEEDIKHPVSDCNATKRTAENRLDPDAAGSTGNAGDTQSVL